MILITQLIYIREGEEHSFHEFEAQAIPIISQYNGRLLLRVRPGKENFIEGTMDLPYEIHLVEFGSDEDFEAFMRDEKRKQFLHLKEQSIKTALLIKGKAL